VFYDSDSLTFQLLAAQRMDFEKDSLGNISYKTPQFLLHKEITD